MCPAIFDWATGSPNIYELKNSGSPSTPSQSSLATASAARTHHSASGQARPHAAMALPDAGSVILGAVGAALYMRSGRFACRSCQQVSDTSQSGSASDRGHAIYHQLHALIENGKPKWQRWSTFNQLEERFERVNEQVNQSLYDVIQRLLRHRR